MEQLGSKLEHTQSLIRQIHSAYNSPAIMLSGGKDSMVLLHLTRGLGFHWPVISHRLPTGDKRKRLFLDKIIDAFDLEVHDFPESKRSLVHGNGKVDINRHYSLHGGEYNVPIANLVESDSPEDDICGYNLLHEKVRPDMENSDLPFDVLLTGTKLSDVDPVIGKVPSVNYLEDREGITFAFPLRDWTDKDITSHTLHNSVPIDMSRYELRGGILVDKEDKSHNPDYLNACTRCINPSLGGTVICPKTGEEMTNSESGRGHGLRKGEVYLL